MTAETLLFFTLKDIAKLNTYCEVTPYSHIRNVMCKTEIFRRSIHYVPLCVLDRVLGGDGFGTRSVSLPESSSD